MNVIFFFILLAKHKLFLNNMYLFMISLNSSAEFFRNFCFQQFINNFKFYYKNDNFLKNEYNFNFNAKKRKFIFKKRFYSSINDCKKYFFFIFEKRLTAELVQNQRRAKIKPLTLAQITKYNELRRMNRVFARFQFEMARLKENYSEIFERWNEKASNVRKITNLSMNNYKKTIKKVSKIYNRRGGLIFRMFYTKKNGDFYSSKILLKILNIYFFLFISIFFKIIKFTYIIKK